MVAVILAVAVISIGGISGLGGAQDSAYAEQAKVPTFKPLEPSGGFGSVDTIVPATGTKPDKTGYGIYDKLKYPLLALVITSISGILVHFRGTRVLRPLMLLTSLVLFGFVNGGCPCVISSFQNLLLLGLGVDINSYNIVWFLGVIVLTYLFGRVWCGWVCHLGALQEFFYRTNRLGFLKGDRAQKILRWIRNTLFVVLIIQLAITKMNLFEEIDPFKVAFNFTSYYAAGWILLGILLVTSLFMYRPFCRGACPVGLVLGWISKLPGTFRLQMNDTCSQCKRCTATCQSQAIDELCRINNSDCILCGDCMETCKVKGIAPLVRGKIPPTAST